jgi:hypothetical protein
VDESQLKIIWDALSLDSAELVAVFAVFQAYKFKDSSLAGCITQQALCIPFSNRATLFDKRIPSEPDELKRLLNGVVCTKLDLPVSTFPDAVLLTWPLAIRATYPSRIPSPQKHAWVGPPDYIHPVTPAALQAAMALYAPRAALSVQEAAVLEYVFQSASMPRFVKGRMLEFYILQQLSVGPSFKLAGFQLGKKTNVASAALTTLADVRAVQQQVVRWNGNALPPGEIDVARNVLFWPNSANYPGVDGMLWLANVKTLVLLQITHLPCRATSRTFGSATIHGLTVAEQTWCTPNQRALADALHHCRQEASARWAVCVHLGPAFGAKHRDVSVAEEWEPSEEAMNEPPPQSDVSSSLREGAHRRARAAAELPCDVSLCRTVHFHHTFTRKFGCCASHCRRQFVLDATTALHCRDTLSATNGL